MAVRSTLVIVATLTALAPVGARAQTGPWSARLTAGGFAVQDAGDWAQIEESVARLWPRRDRAAITLIQTRRFAHWDQSLEAGGTLHPDPRLYLAASATLTPAAEIRERALLHVDASVVLGAFVPSLAYEYRSYDQGPVHQVAPGLTWYGGRWSLHGEMRVVRNDVGTVNLAGIARARIDFDPHWAAWLGTAGGNEDYLVGPPGAQQLRTLRTRSVVAGASWSDPRGWTVRLDLTGVDSKPRLSREGATLSLIRSF